MSNSGVLLRNIVCTIILLFISLASIFLQHLTPVTTSSILGPWTLPSPVFFPFQPSPLHDDFKIRVFSLNLSQSSGFGCFLNTDSSQISHWCFKLNVSKIKLSNLAVPALCAINQPDLHTKKGFFGVGRIL